MGTSSGTIGVRRREGGLETDFEGVEVARSGAVIYKSPVEKR